MQIRGCRDVGKVQERRRITANAPVVSHQDAVGSLQ